MGTSERKPGEGTRRDQEYVEKLSTKDEELCPQEGVRFLFHIWCLKKREETDRGRVPFKCVRLGFSPPLSRRPDTPIRVQTPPVLTTNS